MKIDSFLQTGQQANALNISEAFRRLDIGDVIKARVLESTSNELILKLFNGTVFKAAAMTDTGVAKGELISLMVNSKNDKQVFVEIVRDTANPAAQEQEIFKELLSLDITPDKNNTEIVRCLKSNNLLVNRDIISRIADAISKFNTDPEKVVFLLANNIEPAEKNISSLAQLAEGKLKIGTELDELIKMFERTNDENRVSDAFKKELESLFIKVNPEKLKSELDVKGLYKDVLAKLQDIRDTLSTSSLSNIKGIIDRMENLESSIKFLDDLNSHSTYVQIPLIINDKNTTGELYILKRGHKRKRIDPENTSLLISLNTHNLGLVESLININKRNISLNIRVENDGIIDFIKDNYAHLYNSLGEKGYKLVDTRYSLINKGINILNAVENLEKEFNVNRSSVDYRV